MKQINKRGQANIGSIFNGAVGLVFSIVVGFVLIGILVGANLLEADSAADNATDRLVGNLTAGVDNVSGKIPTIFLVGVAVLLLGLVVFLAVRGKQIQQTQGNSL
jgi:hypothetical protein